MYSIVARWDDASAPVLMWDEEDDKWHDIGMQVGDYCHCAREALRDMVTDAIVASGDDATDDVLDAIMARAVEI